MIQYTDKHLTVFESQIYKTTSTIIETEDCVIVADPCLLPSEIGEIREHVVRVKGNRPLYLILTHSDWDHVVGAGAFPDATVIASAAFRSKKPEEILEPLRAFDDQYYIDRNWPVRYPDVDVAVAKDGERLIVGGTTLTFYEAKGHTDDGIFAIVEPLGIWIAGDYLSNVEFPFIGSSSKDYVETLKKTEMILSKHPINALIPGHGHIAFGKEEIMKRKNDGLLYIASLKQAVRANAEHDHLIAGYPYKRGLKACHEENVQFLMKELAKE
jgi:glyoxylase-like metal-dependent hydrolase (beta-lactamase superfamily II)